MPNEGDVKVEQFFAWFPVRAGFRVRWLCTVRIKYVLYEDFGGGLGGFTAIWTPVEFMPVQP